MMTRWPEDEAHHISTQVIRLPYLQITVHTVHTVHYPIGYANE